MAVKANRPVFAALKLLSENECHGNGIWLKKLKLPEKVIFETFSGYESKIGAKIPHDEGCTVKYGGINIILYSPSWNVKRLNYTLAHELGHILLCHTKNGAAEEAEANLFASALLMPPCVLDAMKERGSLKNARDAARFFGVSVSCAMIAFARKPVKTPYDEKVLSAYKNRMDSFGRGAFNLDIFKDV